MSETLYPYYERELFFIRQLAQEFARQYPAAAGRLLLEPNRSVDPHVERLIESFALLAARVQLKLDDEFPELTEAMLSVLYPHYLAPVPSLAILQFDLDSTRGPLPEGFLIPRHSRLHTPPVRDTACRYRTCYPVRLWPLVVTSARLLPPPFPSGLNPPPRAAAALVLRFEAQAGLKFSDLTLDRLRLHLYGPLHLSGNLYELIFNHTLQVVFRSPDASARATSVTLPPSTCLHQVGFESDEGLFPYPERSFLGYRLLTECFSFPSKFLFLDLAGFQEARRAGIGKNLEVVLFFDRTQESLEQTLDASAFRLGCTPVVNLFEQTAEPIALTQSRYEYRITPDVARPDGCEVYTVDGVSSTDPISGTTTEYQPFYAFRHGTSNEPRTFWYANRRASTREGDRGTDVSLNLVDLDFNPRLPADATLIVRTTCTNRNLPAQLQRFGDQLSMELAAAAPLARIRCLRAPTLPQRPPRRRGAQWRLISHLNLNHLSITTEGEGREALQEILRLYDFSDPEAEKQQAAAIRMIIEGITSVRSRRVVGKADGGGGIGFCRGVEVTLEFDEQKYTDVGGPFLFACVLERFLGLYASINSFSQLVAKTRQGEGNLKKWPPRAGEQILL